VPHFFDQRYDANQTWTLLAAAYRFLGAGARTEFGVTPQSISHASDIDTFLEPSTDVITSGTEGEVRLRSFSLQQRFLLSRFRAVELGVVVSYRQSTAVFLPAERVVIHTQPPSQTREATSDRETTQSRVFASGLAMRATFRSAKGWTTTVEGDVLPITRGRLSVSLPDKYADTLGFEAVGVGLSARVAIERRIGRFGLGAALTGGMTRPYGHTAQYVEHGAGLQLFLAASR
jgi:hypothetical protein